MTMRKSCNENDNLQALINIHIGGFFSRNFLLDDRQIAIGRVIACTKIAEMALKSALQ